VAERQRVEVRGEKVVDLPSPKAASPSAEREKKSNV